MSPTDAVCETILKRVSNWTETMKWKFQDYKKVNINVKKENLSFQGPFFYAGE